MSSQSRVLSDWNLLWTLKERRPFLRRTKATAPTVAEPTITESTTTKFIKRGINRFKTQADTTEPTSFSTTARSDRPTRTYSRRRLGGASANALPTTTEEPTTRSLRLPSRRRPSFSTTLVTTPPPSTTEPITPDVSTTQFRSTTHSTTAFIDSEEILQDIGELDYLEDTSTRTTDAPKTTLNVQRRRPLIQLKGGDLNSAATNEEENTRHSKKYSSSFRQNQLNEILKSRTSAEEIDRTTEGRPHTEDYSAETAGALALAAHQLIAAPVPVTSDYEEPKTTRIPLLSTTTDQYKYTNDQYTKTQRYDESITQAYFSPRTLLEPSTRSYNSYPTESTAQPSTYTSSDMTDTRAPVRFSTPGAYTGRISSQKTDSDTPSTISTFDTTDIRLPTRYNTGSYSGRGTSPFASTSTVNPNLIYSTSDFADTRDPTGFTATGAYTGRIRSTFSTNTINPTISGVSINIGSETGESTARYTNFPTDGSFSTTQSTSSDYESRRTKPVSTNSVSPIPNVALNLGESTARFGLTGREIFTNYPSTVTSKLPRPTGFSPNLVNLDEIREHKSTVRYQSSEKGPSTTRYKESSEKIAVPVVYAYSAGSQGLSQEPSYFTREYLLESPVTKTYDDEYQYLSPVTTTTTTKKPLKRKTIYRRVSSTRTPTSSSTTASSSTTTTTEQPTTVKPRRTSRKPFEKLTVRRTPLRKKTVEKDIIEDNVQKESFQKPAVQKISIHKKPIQDVQKLSTKTHKPVKDYDYYDDSHEKFAGKDDGTKVIVHGKGHIECLDIGNFPHPTSCKKFISCARIESGAVLGWEYICPKGLSFDPVGGICNWSAGLGCDEREA